MLRSLVSTVRATSITNLPFWKDYRAPISTMANRDPNTLSNYNEIRTTQVKINFDIDFEKKRLAGNVLLIFKGLAEKGAKQVILDTR